MCVFLCLHFFSTCPPFILHSLLYTVVLITSSPSVCVRICGMVVPYVCPEWKESIWGRIQRWLLKCVLVWINCNTFEQLSFQLLFCSDGYQPAAELFNHFTSIYYLFFLPFVFPFCDFCVFLLVSVHYYYFLYITLRFGFTISCSFLLFIYFVIPFPSLTLYIFYSLIPISLTLCPFSLYTNLNTSLSQNLFSNCKV